jgi:exopolysaccharide biosynthesis polyprenyl glycosylphosphotransferase
MSYARDRLLPGPLSRIHLVTDLLVLWTVLVWVAGRHVDPLFRATHDWIWLGVMMSALWVLLGTVLRHYADGPVRPAVEDFAVASLLVGAVVLLLALIKLVVPNPAALPPVEPVLVYLWLSVAGLRLLAFRPLQRSYGPDGDVLLVGAGPLARATARNLTLSAPRRRILGHVVLPGERVGGRMRGPIFGRIEHLEQILSRRPVDEVYIAADPAGQPSEVQEAVRVCERLGVPFALPIPALRFGRARPADQNLGIPVAPDGYVHFSPTAAKPYQLALKRLVDVVAASCAVAALSPLLLLVALGVKLSSPGPVLFRQERVGLHGRHFTMLKFRSMYLDAERRKAELETKNEQTGPVFKMKHDPRITPLGRFIRKFSIDELPQLLNVLAGDMSLVGPRPPLPSEVAQYQAWQRRRLSVRPGLTCIWQVSGRNEISFEEWMLLDMRYIDHWGLSADLGLILRTIPVVVTGKGAS